MRPHNYNLEKVDEKVVNELLMHISKSDYLELLNDFIADTKTQLKGVHLQAFKNNKVEVLRVIHTIKGNASSLGFNHLSLYTAEFEELLKTYKGELKSGNFVSFVRCIEGALKDIQFFYDDYDRRWLQEGISGGGQFCNSKFIEEDTSLWKL